MGRCNPKTQTCTRTPWWRSAMGIDWIGSGVGGTPEPAIVSASIVNSDTDALVLVFNTVVTATNSGFTISTDSATGITVSSLSGSGTNTLTLALSRAIVADETLYLIYSGSGDLTATDPLAAFNEPILNQLTLQFDGVSGYGDFGDILDSVLAANDTNFWLEITIDKAVMVDQAGTAAARRLINKTQPSNGPGLNLFINTTRNPIFGYNTNSTNRRTILSDGVVNDGQRLVLKYNGAVDTNDGLDRAVIEIDGAGTTESLSFTTGTLPSLIPNIAEPLAFGDLVNTSNVNNGVAMFKGNVSSLIVRSNNGATVEINIPDMSTGLDISGNNRHLTIRKNVKTFTTYALRSNRDVSAQIGYTSPMDWQGRPRIEELSNGVWIMTFVQGDEHTTDGSQTIEVAFSENKGMPWLPRNTFTDGTQVTGLSFNGEGTYCLADQNLIKCPNGDLVIIASRRLFNATFQGHVQNRSTDNGKTWSGWVDITSQFEGTLVQQWACYDYTVAGTDIYIALSRHDGDLLTEAKCMLYVSSDNCATWTKVSDITDLGDITWEAGIEYLGGTTLLSVIRTSALNESGARVRISTDMGANWSNLSNIAISSKGLHQPRVRKFANENRVYVSGRIYDSAAAQRNGFLYSDNSGTSWTLSEFTAITATDDGGYADLIKRHEDILIMMAYSGVLGATGYIREYVITAV